MAWPVWGLWLLIPGVDLFLFLLFLAPDQTRSGAVKVFDSAAASLPFVAFAIVGVLILSRRHSNVIGWLCWAIGLTASLSGFGSGQAARIIAMGGSMMGRGERTSSAPASVPPNAQRVQLVVNPSRSAA